MASSRRAAHSSTQLIQLPVVMQQTESHCGPAVLEMLLAYLHEQVSQDQIVEAARVRRRIAKHGARPAHLARAVRELAPQYQFWMKEHTTKGDLETIVRKHHWPVAINWQGLFYNSIEEEKKKRRNRKKTDADRGHYSVVVGVSRARNKIVIADPYGEYSKQPRQFSLGWFERRWWDADCEKNPETGQEDEIKTHRLIFIVVPKDETFPEELGMVRV
ncbi:C39 family peptidase [Patescibacteria group bacterium]|nr:C39 family peptidase [Patescibacteria group bacterium]